MISVLWGFGEGSGKADKKGDIYVMRFIGIFKKNREDR